MRQNSLIWLFIPIVAGVPISFYFVSLYLKQNFGKLPVMGKEVIVAGKKTDHTIPAFNLINEEGKAAGNKWNDKIVVVDFFFTHCPVVCPKMTNNLKKVQKSFTEKEIHIASISVDPERDSAGRMKWYIEKFGINTANWEFLTGDKKEIYKLARNGFMIVASDGDGGPDDFIHSDRLILLDTHKRIRGYYDGTSEKEVNTLIQDIKKLKHEN